MTTSGEPPQADLEEVPVQEGEPQPRTPRQRPQNARRERTEQNPLIDPRLARLEHQETAAPRASDASLLVIGIVAFIFGVAMHFWVATSVLDGGEAAQSSAPEATATTDTSPAATSTVQAQPTSTPQPDRTNCDEIRGTQYRSVSEREFFLQNCTGGSTGASTGASTGSTGASP